MYVSGSSCAWSRSAVASIAVDVLGGVDRAAAPGASPRGPGSAGSAGEARPTRAGSRSRSEPAGMLGVVVGRAVEEEPLVVDEAGRPRSWEPAPIHQPERREEREPVREDEQHRETRAALLRSAGVRALIHPGPRRAPRGRRSGRDTRSSGRRTRGQLRPPIRGLRRAAGAPRGVSLPAAWATTRFNRGLAKTAARSASKSSRPGFPASTTSRAGPPGSRARRGAAGTRSARGQVPGERGEDPLGAVAVARFSGERRRAAGGSSRRPSWRRGSRRRRTPAAAGSGRRATSRRGSSRRADPRSARPSRPGARRPPGSTAARTSPRRDPGGPR